MTMAPKRTTVIAVERLRCMCELDVDCYHCGKRFAYAQCDHSRNPVAYCPHCGTPQTAKQRIPTMQADGIPISLNR